MPLMSISRSGADSRMLSVAIRLCPPASRRASLCSPKQRDRFLERARLFVGEWRRLHASSRTLFSHCDRERRRVNATHSPRPQTPRIKPAQNQGGTQWRRNSREKSWSSAAAAAASAGRSPWHSRARARRCVLAASNAANLVEGGQGGRRRWRAGADDDCRRPAHARGLRAGLRQGQRALQALRRAGQQCRRDQRRQVSRSAGRRLDRRLRAEIPRRGAADAAVLAAAQGRRTATSSISSAARRARRGRIS